MWAYFCNKLVVFLCKNVCVFPNRICLKVNVIARLEFELAYYDSAIQRFNYYTTRMPPLHGFMLF